MMIEFNSNEEIRTYLVKITYDGSSYAGWAKQPHKKTIEGEINEILKRVFKTPITINGASRTDRGVHAVEQYFTFVLKQNFTCEKVKQVLTYHFRAAIQIKDVSLVSNDYDLRANVISKYYHYYINFGKKTPFCGKFEYQYWNNLKRRTLKKALKLFVGRHYFFNFSGLTKLSAKNRYRVIDKIKVYQFNKKILIVVKGRGFLRYQIRTIIASAIHYCENKVTLAEIRQYLDSATEKKYPFPKVPGTGLYLQKIKLISQK